MTEQPKEPVQSGHAGTPDLLGTTIAVLDRGWVYAGRCVIHGEYLYISGARNIRRWGTTKGLAELRDGPTRNTVLDDTGDVIVPMRAVIHLIKCNRDW